MAEEKTITLGVPVFHGWDVVAQTLDSIQKQSYADFEVLISVDGADSRSAQPCRPFLADDRFRIVIQRDRLGWAGNINWLLSQFRTDFFCYQQQDDLLDRDYLRALVDEARLHPTAAVIHCDVQFFGSLDHSACSETISGEALERVRTQIEYANWVPFRGLVRKNAARAAGGLRMHEYDSFAEDVVWVTKLARWGEIRRVARPLYFKRWSATNTSAKWDAWAAERKRNAWLVFGTGLMQAAVPVPASSEGRLSIIFTVLERLLIEKPGRWAFYGTGALSAEERRKFVIDIFSRARRDRALDPARLNETWRSLCARSLRHFGLRPLGALELRPGFAWLRSALETWRPWTPAARAGQAQQVARLRKVSHPERVYPPEWLSATDWYAPEHDPRFGAFRWSGPGNSSTIELPVRFDAPVVLKIHVIHTMAPDRLGSTSIWVEDRIADLAVERTDAGTFVMSGTGHPHSKSRKARALRLKIQVHGTARPSDKGESADTRPLGIAVNWIELAPANPA